MRHQDKRRFRRLAFKTKVAFVIGTRLLLADLVDISATGCRLRIEDDRPVKGPVTPSFQVARLEVAARRIWRRGNEAGFRFVYTQVEPDAPSWTNAPKALRPEDRHTGSAFNWL